jgi:hypothetical protein
MWAVRLAAVEVAAASEEEKQWKGGRKPGRDNRTPYVVIGRSARVD